MGNDNEPLAAVPDSPEPEVSEKDKRENALRKAYTQATTDLRTKHQSEFNELMKLHAKAAGYDWEPKKTAEDRAREQVAEILEKFPKLAEELAGTVFEVQA